MKGFEEDWKQKGTSPSGRKGWSELGSNTKGRVEVGVWPSDLFLVKTVVLQSFVFYSIQCTP